MFYLNSTFGIGENTSMDTTMAILRGAMGIAILIGFCYLLSTDKKSINWRLVISGLALQLVLALLMLKVPIVRQGFEIIVNFFVAMIGASEESAIFIFGDLARTGGPFGFAFTVLPTIVFFSALSSLLYYLGILQKVVYGFAYVMSKTMQLSGAESLAAAANVFIGQTEAPLVVKPYLESMTKSEMNCLMTGGMATIAGGVFGAYLQMLGGDTDAERLLFGMHLLTASIISAPAAIVAAKILFPEPDLSKVNQNIDVPKSAAGSNLLDALARGTTEGVKLAVNVGAMLLAFMAFIYLANIVFSNIGDINIGDTCINQMVIDGHDGLFKDGLSLQLIMGYLFAPVAWIIGVSGQDILAMGQMLGEKTILNEFVAYASLMDFKNSGVLSEKTVIIATYALCGFANFASIGIQIGGIGSLAPGQRKTLSELGVKALIGGTVACLLTACIAGFLA